MAKQEWSFVPGVGNMYFYTCPTCRMWTGVPVETEKLARARPGLSLYCTNGHATSFSKGESEEDKLRRERDRLKQETAWYSDALREAQTRADTAERRRIAAKGQVTKLKNRAKAGLCPCCNRSFVKLAQHMATRHPGFIHEPTADEHVH